MRECATDGQPDFQAFQQFLRFGTIAKHPLSDGHLRAHRDRLVEANRPFELQLGVTAHGNRKPTLIDAAIRNCQFDRLVETKSRRAFLAGQRDEFTRERSWRKFTSWNSTRPIRVEWVDSSPLIG